MEDMMTDTLTEQPTITIAALSLRLAELRQNHTDITQELEKLEAHRQQGASTLLLLSGAIQVLVELMGPPAVLD
jgi:hypothetical protein